MMAQFLKRPITPRPKPDDLPGVSGPARLDRRTKNLTKRLAPGDIAIIDHEDLDRVSAEALLHRQVAAVVNVAASISGRYPNAGPQLLVEAGIPLLDQVGPEVFDLVSEGKAVRLHEETLYLGEEAVATGRLLTAGSVRAAMTEAQAGVTAQLQAFVANTLEYVAKEGGLLVDGIAAPEIRSRIEGRHVLVVVRGHQHREDLATLRPYIREFKPVLVAVDGGADALLDAGYRPDLIVGDMDSVSDRALQCGAELVVHAYEDGRAPGRARLDRLGCASVAVAMPGISEDLAMLLAHEKGADLIVAVGTRFNLVEFLERNRAGMSSTFLTRLKVGEILVDARGVSRLFRQRAGLWPLIAFGIAALGVVVAAVASSPGLRDFISALVDRLLTLIGVE